MNDFLSYKSFLFSWSLRIYNLSFLTILQISDFLSGHSPLTINLGIGAHVMYVQLQLSEQDVKKLQENGDLRIQRNTELQTSLSTAVGMSQADSGSMSFITSESPQKSSTPVLDSGVCPTAVHDNVERPLNPNAVSFSSIPRANNQQYSSLPQSSQFGHTQPSAYSQSSGPLQATAPISSSAPAGFSPGPPSPVEATTFEKVIVISYKTIYISHLLVPNMTKYTKHVLFFLPE